MNILLIRLTALGDVVLVEPIVRALREKHPGARIDLLTEARYAELAGATFGVDSAIGYDRRGKDAGYAGLARVVEGLPVPKYNLVADLQGKIRTRALARGVPADERLVLRKRSLGEAVLAILGNDPPIDDRHATELYASVFGELRVDSIPRLSRPKPALEKHAGELLIGLSPGATHATKRWAPERFAEVADALPAHARFVLIGGEGDRTTLETIRASSKTAKIDPLDVTKLDVFAMCRVLASFDLLISVDTGPAHLAAGFGVPVVVLFGPTSITRWAPRAPEHRVVSLRLDCSPCSNMGGEKCPRPDRDHACLRELSVEAVLNAARSALGAG
jgi:ADP-heptose:LPS heptosyltransferase